MKIIIFKFARATIGLEALCLSFLGLLNLFWIGARKEFFVFGLIIGALLIVSLMMDKE